MIVDRLEDVTNPHLVVRSRDIVPGRHDGEAFVVLDQVATVGVFTYRRQPDGRWAHFTGFAWPTALARALAPLILDLAHRRPVPEVKPASLLEVGNAGPRAVLGRTIHKVSAKEVWMLTLLDALGGEPELVSIVTYGKIPGGWSSKGTYPLPTRIAVEVAAAILRHGA